MSVQRAEPWSDKEKDIVAMCGDGEITVMTMIDTLRERSPRAIARKFAGLPVYDPITRKRVNPDSEMRERRKCEVGCAALERAMKKVMGRC